MNKRVRRLVAAMAVLMLLAAGAIWLAEWQLICPRMTAAGPPPPALHAEVVSFSSLSGSNIHGWLSRGVTGRGAILLLHGVRANRLDMLSRALFLHELGYSVLLIDLQGHGESPGRWITFGDLESRDAAAAMDYLHTQLPGEHVGVIGVSLGAAAITLAPKPLHVDAVVLESMYPSIEQAVADRLRMHLGSWAEWGAPILISQVARQIHVDPKRLRPIREVGQLGVPLLLIHGLRDQHTSIEEARSIFAAASEPKTLWEVPGAAHVNLHRFAKQEYEQRVTAFFSRSFNSAKVESYAR